MGWNKILIFTIIVCCCYSCLNYHISSKNGAYLPKNPKFNLQENPYQLKKEDLIDNQRLYFYNDTLSYGKGDYNKLFYIRFFKNGKCYRSSIDIKNMSNIKELNTPTSVGYYSVSDHTKVNMEFFHVKYKERGWYSKNEGFIRNDTLFIKGTDKQENEVLRIYTPKKIEGLIQTTDW